MPASDFNGVVDRARARLRLRVGVVPILLFALFATLPFNRIIALRRAIVIAVVLATVATAWRARRRLPVPTPLLALVGVWFALAPLSILWSVRPSFTAGELVADVFYPLAGFAAALVLVDRWSRARVALAGLFAGAASVSASGLVLWLGTKGYDWYELAHGVGKLSTYLIAVLPFALLGLVDARRRGLARQAGGFAVLTALLFAAAYTTENRMFWIAAFAVMGVVAYCIARRPEFAWSARRIGLVAAIGSTGLAGLFAIVSSGKRANVVGDSPDTSIGALLTNSERFEIWRFWIDRWQEHPLLGIGFGHDLPMRHYQALKPAHWFDLMFAHAHNVFIDVAVQLGALGLAVFVAVIVLLARSYARAVRAAEPRRVLAGIAGLALLAGVLAKNFTDDFFSRAPLFDFWLLNGLVLAIIGRAWAEHDREGLA